MAPGAVHVQTALHGPPSAIKMMALSSMHGSHFAPASVTKTLTLITVLCVIAIAILIVIAYLLPEVRFAIHLASQQLEYLGAPLEFTNGVLHAARRGYERDRSRDTF